MPAVVNAVLMKNVLRCIWLILDFRFRISDFFKRGDAESQRKKGSGNISSSLHRCVSAVKENPKSAI